MVIPTQFVYFTVSVIVGSAIVYGDFEKTTKGDLFMFFGGCLCTFVGVFCILHGRQQYSELVDLQERCDNVSEPFSEATQLLTGNDRPGSIDSWEGPLGIPTWNGHLARHVSSSRLQKTRSLSGGSLQVVR